MKGFRRRGQPTAVSDSSGAGEPVETGPVVDPESDGGPEPVAITPPAAGSESSSPVEAKVVPIPSSASSARRETSRAPSKRPARRPSKRKTEVLTSVSTVTIPISQEAKAEARQALESAIASGNYSHQYLSDIATAAVLTFLEGELDSLMPCHQNSPKENVSFKLDGDSRQLYDSKLPRRRRAEIIERILRTYVNRHYPAG